MLFTPQRGVLEGITRQSVFDIAKARDIPFRLEDVPVELAYHADEIFFCTTAGGIMPVTILDDKNMGTGKVGTLTNVIWGDYWDMHYSGTYSAPVEYP